MTKAGRVPGIPGRVSVPRHAIAGLTWSSTSAATWRSAGKTIRKSRTCHELGAGRSADAKA